MQTITIGGSKGSKNALWLFLKHPRKQEQFRHPPIPSHTNDAIQEILNLGSSCKKADHEALKYGTPLEQSSFRRWKTKATLKKNLSRTKSAYSNLEVPSIQETD